MTPTGRYTVNWTHFNESTSTAFKDLGTRKDFADVTLACDEDHQVEVHKVIIAACSSFFRGILLRNPHPHPVIYLDSVKAVQLEALVTFMYTGETNIPQEQLEEFMVIAKKYRVVGLMEERGGMEDQILIRQELKEGRSSRGLPKEETRKKEPGVTLAEIDLMENKKTKKEEHVTEDGLEVDDSEVMYKREVVAVMNVPMGNAVEEDDEIPESDLSTLFIAPSICGDTDNIAEEEDEEEMEIIANDDDNEELKEDDDEDEEDDTDNEDDEDNYLNDPDYELEDDEENCPLEEVKPEPRDKFVEDLTKILLKTRENTEDVKFNPILMLQQNPQKKRKYSNE